MSKQPATTNAKNKAIRQAIYDADPIGFAIRHGLMGIPMPKRDLAGRVVGQEEPLDAAKRMDIAMALARKIAPDLAAAHLELGGAGGELGFKIILGDGVLPPASVDDAQVIEHEASKQIEGDVGVSAPQIADQEGVSFPPDEDLVRDPEPVSNPARKPAEPQRSKAAAPPPKTLPVDVLAVEDDVNEAEEIRVILGEHGYATKMVTSPDDLKLVPGDPPDGPRIHRRTRRRTT